MSTNVLKLYGLRNNKCRVFIPGNEIEEYEAEPYSSLKNKYSKIADKAKRKKVENKDAQLLKFVEGFNSINEKYHIYLFPYFNGDVSLIQVYANVLQKVKSKGFFGLFKKKKKQTVEDVKEELADLFHYGAQDEENYFKFLQKYTEQACDPNKNCIVSIHPRNLHLYLKSFKSQIEESCIKNNCIIRSSSEVFMELGLSNNNSIILPLIDTIVENNLPNKEKLV